MTQIQALAALVGLIVLLFAGIYWLGHIAPGSDSPGEDGESEHHSSHGGAEMSRYADQVVVGRDLDVS